MNPYLSSQEIQVKASFRKRKIKFENHADIKLDPEYQLGIGDFQIDKQSVLGRGNFGIVYKGTVKGKAAAIKSPTGAFKTVFNEAKIHSHLEKHTNIVEFLGIYEKEIENGNLYIATDICCNGSLETFLHEKKADLETSNGLASQNDALSQTLARFCLEIARGMEHLQKKGVVHRDLASRNVFLDSNFVCKVGDFGLSGKADQYYKPSKKSNEPLAWRWMAYESLTELDFSTESDMWSYGVTLWEIFTLGSTPYSEYSWTHTFVKKLKSGLRLPAPRWAMEITYNKILECWYIKTEQRPSFSDMVFFFSNLSDGQTSK